MTHQTIALVILLVSSLAQAADLEPWHGKVLQVDVQHPGGDWVAREVRSLVHSSSEHGNVQRAFVDVEYVSEKSRRITLTCGGNTLAEETITFEYSGVITGTCYGVSESITLVPISKARFPKEGKLPLPSTQVK